jgi:hypothetical protein
LIAIFYDHNFDISVLETLLAFKNISGVDSHHNFGLLVNESDSNSFDFEISLLMRLSDINNFDSDLFFGLTIHSSVYGCILSSSNLLEDIIFIYFGIGKLFIFIEIIFIIKIKIFVIGFDLFFIH